MWIPIRRYVFIYSYMPALYFGFLALAGALDECWKGSARAGNISYCLAPLVPCLIFGLGVAWGAFLACSVSIVYLLLRRYPEAGMESLFV